MKKFSKLVLAFLLMVSVLFPTLARAGVVTGELVEVDEELNQELEAYRIKLDECESDKYKLEARAKDLDSKIASLAAKMKDLAGNNDKLSAELNKLRSENQSLSSRIANLQTETAKAPEPTPQPKKKAVVKSGDTCDVHPIKSPLGVIVGAPVGTVAGVVRGAVTKGIETSDAMQESLGDNIPSQILSKTVGFVFGTIPGVVTGLISGLVDGIKYGWCDPFSARSISLEGDFVGDWDSYEKFRN